MDYKNSVAFVVGEASGDVHAALLLDSIKRSFEKNNEICPHFFGITGEHLRLRQVESIENIQNLSVMGLVKVVLKYAEIRKIYFKVLAEIKKRKPKLVIFIDFPGFNLRLLEAVSHLGIACIYHIPPQVWIHGFLRIEILKKYTKFVNCVYPFENEFLKLHGCSSSFYGNPLANEIFKFEKENSSIVSNKNHIALLPGSRIGEIHSIFPVMINSFVELLKTNLKLEAFIPVAPTIGTEYLKNFLVQHLKSIHVENLDLKFHFVQNKIYTVLKECHYAFVCSGTASFEAAISKTPHCIVYKCGYLNYTIGKMIVKSPFIGLANLCRNEKIVPEFLQSDCTVFNLTEHAKNIFENKNNCRDMMISQFEKLRQQFLGVSFDDFGKKIRDLIHTQ